MVFALLLCSCSSKNTQVIQIVQTVIGVDVSYNPQTQLPQGKMGYGRSVVMIVPTDVGHTNGSANVTPDMYMAFSVDAQWTGIKIVDKFVIGAPARHSSNEIAKSFMSNSDVERSLFGK